MKEEKYVLYMVFLTIFVTLFVGSLNLGLQLNAIKRENEIKKHTEEMLYGSLYNLQNLCTHKISWQIVGDEVLVSCGIN